MLVFGRKPTDSEQKLLSHPKVTYIEIEDVYTGEKTYNIENPELLNYLSTQLALWIKKNQNANICLNNEE